MTKDNNEEKVCSKCKKSKKLKTDYYISASDLIHSDGRLGVCRQCLWNIIDFDNKSSLIIAMRSIDRPFLIEMYNVARDSKKKNKSGEYMRLLGMKQNRYLTYADSDFGEDGEEALKKVSDYKYDEIGFTEDEMEQLIQFWGRGFTLEEYEFLQTEYETFLNAYEADSYTMQILFQEAAQQRLTIKQKREKGESVDKDVDTLQKIFTSANIKPNQETGANATDQATFGTLIKKFEDERPVDEVDPEWKSSKKIRKYIDIFFKGHLSKMLGLENDTQEEYDKEMGKYTVTPPSYEGDEK